MHKGPVACKVGIFFEQLPHGRLVDMVLGLGDLFTDDQNTSGTKCPLRCPAKVGRRPTPERSASSKYHAVWLGQVP
jgi:hypothetical protein